MHTSGVNRQLLWSGLNYVQLIIQPNSKIRTLYIRQIWTDHNLNFEIIILFILEYSCHLSRHFVFWHSSIVLLSILRFPSLYFSFFWWLRDKIRTALLSTRFITCIFASWAFPNFGGPAAWGCLRNDLHFGTCFLHLSSNNKDLELTAGHRLFDRFQGNPLTKLDNLVFLSVKSCLLIFNKY